MKPFDAFPVIGRVFRPEEDKPGAPPVAVLSYALWQGRFCGDPGIVNQSITLDGRLYTVVGQGMRLTWLGVGIGLIAALALARPLQNLLFEIQPVDLPTFLTVSVVLGGVALLACYLPARRAANVDPMAALRYE